MVTIEGGTFYMGATEEQDTFAYNDEKPIHEVQLSTFKIGRYEVTQEEWETVMKSNPSEFKGSRHPVEQVSWDDCMVFIRRLNEMTNLKFRLPTEAEWEYAARGGNKSSKTMFSGSNKPDNVAWYDMISDRETHDVGQKQCNELGLYDMSGNVFEWCQDGFYTYTDSYQKDPVHPSDGGLKVYRGGSWSSGSRFCRVSVRNFISHDRNRRSTGLRLAM